MRALACVLLLLPLAGCAENGTGSWSSVPHERLELDPPRVVDVGLASGSFDLAPGATWATNVTIPEGAVQVVLAVNFTGGAIALFDARLGSCGFAAQGPAPATGQTLGVDCGALAAGSTDLTFSSAAPLTAIYVISGKLCRSSVGSATGCPGGS